MKDRDGGGRVEAEIASKCGRRAAGRLGAGNRRHRLGRWLWLGALVSFVATSAVLALWLHSRDRPGPAPDTESAPESAASGIPAPALPARPDAVPLEFTECWFAKPAGQRASCGVLTVPEDWNAENSRPLHLKFVIFHGAARPTGDPVIYVNGGPGDAADIDSGSIDSWWALIDRTGWLKARDVVVFDQRGVGVSAEPPMNCPELADAAARVFAQPLDVGQSNEAWSGAARQCYDRLRRLGIDLDRYNTEANIADLHSLIKHLGYRSWNLLAVSYGTRVALGFIDRWPEGTSAVVLDSVYPGEVAVYVDAGKGAATAFAALFEECEADRSCHAAYPDIAGTFNRVVRAAAVKPIAVSLANPLGGARLQAHLEDSRLIEVLLQAFYDWHEIARLPAIITALAAGDTRPLEDLADATVKVYGSDRVSHGVFFSVECHDEFPLPGRDAMDRAAAEVPLYRNFMLSNLPLAVCPAWQLDRVDPRERVATNRDVPILILSGELDPITPPQWGRAITATRKARQIEFRGVGHGVLAAHACAGRIVDRFLNDPAVSLDDCALENLGPVFRQSRNIPLRKPRPGPPKPGGRPVP